MVNAMGVAKAKDEVVEDLVCHSPARLVLGRISLCKFCEVIHDDQDILKSSLAPLQVEEINRDNLEWGCGGDCAEGLSCVSGWLSVLETRTDLHAIMFDVTLHVGPVKALPRQIQCSPGTNMPHVVVEFTIGSWSEAGWKYHLSS